MLVPLFLRYIIPSCGTLIFPDFSRKNTSIVFSGLGRFSRLCHGFAGVLSSRFLGVRSGFNAGYSLASSSLQHVLTRLYGGIFKAAISLCSSFVR